MMQAIQGGMASAMLSRPDAKMTAEQSEKLSEVLENYDTENLSYEDAKSLVSQISELGIEPGRDLAAALGEAGLDARDLANQAGIGRGGDRPPPPPPGAGGKGSDSVEDAVVSLISEAVEAYSETSEDQTLGSYVMSALEEAGYDTSKPVIDFYS